VLLETLRWAFGPLTCRTERVSSACQLESCATLTSVWFRYFRVSIIEIITSQVCRKKDHCSLVLLCEFCTARESIWFREKITCRRLVGQNPKSPNGIFAYGGLTVAFCQPNWTTKFGLRDWGSEEMMAGAGAKNTEREENERGVWNTISSCNWNFSGAHNLRCQVLGTDYTGLVSRGAQTN